MIILNRLTVEGTVFRFATTDVKEVSEDKHSATCWVKYYDPEEMSYRVCKVAMTFDEVLSAIKENNYA